MRDVDEEIDRFAKWLNKVSYGDPPKQKGDPMIEKLIRFCFPRTVHSIEDAATGAAMKFVIDEIIQAVPKDPAKKFTANYYAKETAMRILKLLQGAPRFDLSFRTVERKPRMKKIAQQEMKEEVKP